MWQILQPRNTTSHLIMLHCNLDDWHVPFNWVGYAPPALSNTFSCPRLKLIWPYSHLSLIHLNFTLKFKLGPWLLKYSTTKYRNRPTKEKWGDKRQFSSRFLNFGMSRDPGRSSDKSVVSLSPRHIVYLCGGIPKTERHCKNKDKSAEW